MIAVDSNLLIYAYNTSAPEHDRARRWLATVLSGDIPVLLPWSSIHAFLRVTTNTRVFDPAFFSEEAAIVVDQWLQRSHVRILAAGPRYWSILRELLTKHEVRRDLVIDAHLAALAIEHDATVYTTDRDFARFTGLRVINPLAS